MGRLASYDAAALAKVIRRQNGVITREQAFSCQLTEAALRHRIRVGGPWRTVLPGVYLTNSGILTAGQPEIAAFLYASHQVAISGPAALAWHNITAERTDHIDVLVEPRCGRRDGSFVRLHRTSVAPASVFPDGPVCYVPPARAVADTVRFIGDADMAKIRAIVAASVQRSKVQVAELADELARGPAHGSARLRLVLAEVADGVRSAAEGDLRSLVRRERLPMPQFNPRLFVGQEFLASPDAWWPEAYVAAEVDSREWHLSPADWARTMARHSRMSARGIIVLHFAPSRLRSAPREVAGEIRSAIKAGSGRQLPEIRALPPR